MNNHQLINVFPPHPQHSIHRVPSGHLFNQWLTFTAQLPSIGGQRWDIIRQGVLDALYDDWELYKAHNIDTP